MDALCSKPLLKRNWLPSVKTKNQFPVLSEYNNIMISYRIFHPICQNADGYLMAGFISGKELLSPNRDTFPSDGILSE